MRWGDASSSAPLQRSDSVPRKHKEGSRLTTFNWAVRSAIVDTISEARCNACRSHATLMSYASKTWLSNRCCGDFRQVNDSWAATVTEKHDCLLDPRCRLRLLLLASSTCGDPQAFLGPFSPNTTDTAQKQRANCSTLGSGFSTETNLRLVTLFFGLRNSERCSAKCGFSG